MAASRLWLLRQPLRQLCIRTFDYELPTILLKGRFQVSALRLTGETTN